MTESVTGNPVISSYSEATQTFTFKYITNLDPLVNPLAQFKDYTIRVTGTAGDVFTTSVSALFNLKVKNPCFDPLYVSITPGNLPAGKYTLFDGSLSSPKNVVKSGSYTVVTSPIAHTLCGSVTYTATFDGAVIDLLTVPVRY